MNDVGTLLSRDRRTDDQSGLAGWQAGITSPLIGQDTLVSYNTTSTVPPRARGVSCPFSFRCVWRADGIRTILLTYT